MLQTLAVCASFLAASNVCAEMLELPRLRDNKSLIFTYLAAPLIDRQFPPTWSLPYNRSFTVIEVGVRMGPDQDRLAEVAGYIVTARLQELGVSDQLGVVIAHEERPTSWPLGTISCDVLKLTFAIAVTRAESNSEQAAALATTLFATQDATDGVGNCAEPATLQPEVMTTWPRASMVGNVTDEGIFAQAQREVANLIDQEIVRKIIWTNETARTTVESWLKVPN